MATGTTIYETATFAGGCFWCTEAIFRELRGVESVTSGYSGGTIEHPTYRQVTSGTSGHAEAVQIIFDPAIVTFEQLVEVFFLTHDPTQLDRQDHDVGLQYRSAIFYHDNDQLAVAVRVMARLEFAHVFPQPVVTKLLPFTAFYPAERARQQFYEKNADASYCRVVIDPKVAAFRKRFARLLSPP